MHDVAAVAATVPRDERARTRRATTRAPSAFRARVPRANSITIVASTNAENVYATRPGIELPAPRTSSTTPVASATTVGQRNVVARLLSDARRQAMSGPIPISSSSGKPNARRKKS